MNLAPYLKLLILWLSLLQWYPGFSKPGMSYTKGIHGWTPADNNKPEFLLGPWSIFTMATGSISGNCWYDYGQEGIRDPQDKPMKNITVCIADEFENIIACKRTNLAGRYEFTQVPAEEKYKLMFYSGSDYFFTVKNGSGYAHNDSDVDDQGKSAVFSLKKDEHMVMDAGLIFNCLSKTAALKIESISEVCYSGRPILVKFITQENAVIPKDYQCKYILTSGPFQKILEVSDQLQFQIHSGGIFNIYQLIYSDQPEHYNYFDLSFVTPGTTNIVELSSTAMSRQLCATISTKPLSFYVNECISIAGRVWNDKNANGKQDENENGLEQSTIYLLNATNEFLDSSATNSMGNYHFGALNPSLKYRISIKPSNEFHLTKPKASGSDQNDSDVDLQGKSDIIYISPGTQAIVDVGMIRNERSFTSLDGNSDETIRETNNPFNTDDKIQYLNSKNEIIPHLRIFPNHCIDRVHFEVKNPEWINPIIHISIFNISSILIKSQIIEGHLHTLNVSDFPSGFYFIQWQSGNEKGILKFIKK